MSYVPPPPSSPGSPPGSPSGPPGPPPGGRKPKTPLVVGALIGAVTPIVATVSSAVIGMETAFLGLGLFSWLGVLVIGVVLLFFQDTRRWGAGILIGFFAMLVIGAGACVVLLASLNSSYGA